ncbi:MULTISPECIES: CoA-transferase [Lysinibacillus]|uniref:CoA-transferase n=1 Tax=Lysinibacillus TaxID=400634 RepID=UPI001FE31399|nr:MULTISPECIES: CoA-transferase [Lysinibacillus]
MIQKKYDSASQAVADIKDVSTLLVGGFGRSRLPSQLVAALVEQGALKSGGSFFSQADLLTI